MGERVACSFRAGGKIPRHHAEELVRIASEEFGRPSDIGECPANKGRDDDELTIHDVGAQWTWYELNYGNLDELTDYCAANGIDYEYWCDSGSEWDARKDRVIGGEMISFPCGNDGDYILLDDLVELDALATGWAKLHDRIKKWKAPFPAAEIVDG